MSQHTRAGQAIIRAWRTTNQATTYLIGHLPQDIWAREIPGIPRKTVGMIAAHLHNSRCTWTKSIGARHGIVAPRLVNLRKVTRRELLGALPKSSDAIVELIELGVANGGVVPRARWQNFPTDLEHFLAYFVAHEAHHRGQLILAARLLGHRLPPEVTGGVWQWIRLSRR